MPCDTKRCPAMPKLNPVTPNQTRWHRAAPGDTQTAPGDAQTAHVGAHTVPGNARRRPPVTVPLTPEQLPCPHPPSPTLCLWGVCAGGGTEGSRAPSRPSALLRALPAAASPLLSLPRDSAWRGGGGFLVPSPPQEGPGPCARRHAAPSACRAGGGGEGCSEPSRCAAGERGVRGCGAMGGGPASTTHPTHSAAGRGCALCSPPSSIAHTARRDPPPLQRSARGGGSAPERTIPPSRPPGWEGWPRAAFPHRDPPGLHRLRSAPRTGVTRGERGRVPPPALGHGGVTPRTRLKVGGRLAG